MIRSTPSREIAGKAARLANASIKDKNGREARIVSLDQEDDEAIALLRLDDGQTVRARLSSLEMADDEGSLYSPHAFEELVHAQQEERLVIPVIQEEMNVGKRVVDTGKGVRVVKRVHEREEKVILPLIQENLKVEHVDIGMIVSPDNLPVARQEGDTYIVPVLEEVLVLEKKIILKKEVRITRTKKEVSKVEKIRLRKEELSVEHFNENDGQMT